MNRLCADKPDDALHCAIALKDGEKYVFLWTKPHAAELLRTVGRFASNPDLSFSWHDAALMAKKIRGQREPSA